MQSRLLHTFFILSGLITASFLFVVDLFGLLMFSEGSVSSNDLPIVLTVIFGLIGYIGYWSLLIFRFKKFKVTTIIMLTLGIFSGLFIIDELFDVVDMFYENMIFTQFIFYWSNIVAMIYIILLLKALFAQKKSQSL